MALTHNLIIKANKQRSLYNIQCKVVLKMLNDKYLEGSKERILCHFQGKVKRLGELN